MKEEFLVSLTGKTNAEKIWNYLIKELDNPYGVAGIMGNMKAESDLRPNKLQDSYKESLGMTDESYTNAVDDGSYENFGSDWAGYGLIQWVSPSLKQEFYDYFISKHISIADLETQLEFLCYQLKKDFKTLIWDVCAGASNVREASDAVLFEFEPREDESESAQEQRATFGALFYEEFYSSEFHAQPIETVEVTILTKLNEVEHKDPDEEHNTMKYSEEKEPIQCIMTNSTCYLSTRKFTPKGILWHSAGMNSVYLRRFVQPSKNDPNYNELIKLLGKNTYGNDLNHIHKESGVNCWIGKAADGAVISVQTLPWDYLPWGCGAGKNGSCNDYWIQLEICEDALVDTEYFAKAYNEACQITAYLCKKFNIDPQGMVSYKNINVPTILCHQDAYQLGLGTNHNDVYHWFKKHDTTMQDVRDNVQRLLTREYSKDMPKPTIPVVIEQSYDFKVGDEIALKPNTTYMSGRTIPAWIFNAKLHIRQINDDSIVFATFKDKEILGIVSKESIILISSPFEQYDVIITSSAVNVRSGPGMSYEINLTVHRGDILTIIEEEDGWGRIETDLGWINLKFTEKM